MTEMERLERLAKQLAVLSVELHAMDRSGDGWTLSNMAESLMRASMELAEKERLRLVNEAAAEVDVG